MEYKRNMWADDIQNDLKSLRLTLSKTEQSITDTMKQCNHTFKNGSSALVKYQVQAATYNTPTMYGVRCTVCETRLTE